MREITRDQVVEVVGSLDHWEVSHDAYRFRPKYSVSFQTLQKISDLFGTERIDLEPGREGWRWSTLTYEDGSPGYIVVYRD